MSLHMHAEPGGSAALENDSRPPTLTPMTRRHVACLRCRRRKQRCDGLLPACANCTRARVDCYQGVTSSNISRSRLHYLENRVRELEGNEGQERDSSAEAPPVNYIQNTADDPSINHQTSPISATQRPEPPSQANAQVPTESPITQSPSVSVPGSITRDQPLAHEVGMLSLANSTDPKYLGPSSGVAFARLIYASAPQSQGLPLSHQNQFDTSDTQERGLPQNIEVTELPSLAECQQYAEAYFEVALFLPFLANDDVFVLVEDVHSFTKTGSWNHNIPVTIAFSQVFLVLSLGARLLETKLKTSFNSSGLLASGMQYSNQIALHESVEGIQILLLIALNSFYNPDGLNAWHLLHTIIASCLDLGLQRRDNGLRDNETYDQRKRRYIRSGVFWSAYSLDRSLTTILGRPLTLRDEAIDVDFPGTDQGSEAEMGALEWSRCDVNIETRVGPYLPCIYTLRFDRIVAEIKLMLYRVSRSPSRFPWPSDMGRWQGDVEASCHSLLDEVVKRQRVRLTGATSSLSLLAVQKLQIKYHQCLMLLYRPSPQIPRPSPQAARTCFNSAIEIIRISADLHRFMKMDFTWLSAHSIFVAAITVFYYLWVNPEGSPIMEAPESLQILETAHQLLGSLSDTWSVAKEACQKLASLILMAREAQSSFFGQGTTAEEYPAANVAQRPFDTGVQANMNNNYNTTTEYWSQQGANALVDELGILREFFDLGWLDNITLDPLPLS